MKRIGIVLWLSFYARISAPTFYWSAAFAGRGLHVSHGAGDVRERTQVHGAVKQTKNEHSRRKVYVSLEKIHHGSSVLRESGAGRGI